MTVLERIQRQQLLREAEGYLELITVFAGHWAPSPETRDRLAVRALRILDRTGSKDPQSLYLRGQALRAMELHEQAIRPLEEAAEAAPGELDTWLALGWCYKRTGQIQLAIQALENALSIAPTESLVHYNLACYWSLAKNVRRAVQHLAQALELDPSYRELVPYEVDFDPIREQPSFQALVSVIV